MLIEIPVFKRCCICIPLRRGLIIWGYFNLFIGCLLLIGSNVALIKMRHLPENEKYKITTDFIVISFITMAIGTIQIILSTVFIVGCHKKNVKLVKTFYYYNIMLLTVTAILTLYSCVLRLTVSIDGLNNGGNINWYIYIMSVEVGLFVTNFFLQFYMLLIARSEIMKLSNNCQFRFANIGVEAECSIITQDSTTQTAVKNNCVIRNH